MTRAEAEPPAATFLRDHNVMASNN